MLSIDDLKTPDLYFLVFNDVAVFDHNKDVLWLMTHTEGDEPVSEVHQRLEELKQSWTSTSEESAHSPVNVSSSECVPAAPLLKKLSGSCRND